MQLLDVVLGKRDIVPSAKDQIHYLGVTRHLLLVPSVEGLDLQIRQQLLDLAV
jgi:hypothetical protein